MEFADVLGLLQGEDDNEIDDEIQKLVDGETGSQKGEELRQSGRDQRYPESEGHHPEGHSAGRADHQGVRWKN